VPVVFDQDGKPFQGGSGSQRSDPGVVASILGCRSGAKVSRYERFQREPTLPGPFRGRIGRLGRVGLRSR
jgi:hypothetical protein